MKRFRNILVGVDLMNVDPQAPVALSRPSRRAFARAIWLAAHTQGKLTIFSAIAVSPFIQDLLQEQLSQASDRPGARQRRSSIVSSRKRRQRALPRPPSSRSALPGRKSAGKSGTPTMTL